MRILAVTNMYPSSRWPASGVFVHEQIKGLSTIGLDLRVMFVNRKQDGPLSYYRMEPELRRFIAEFAPDLIHVMYGGVMAERVTSYRNLPPAVVTFHGTDLLGERISGSVRRWVSRFGVYCSRRAARRAMGVVVVARHLLKFLPEAVTTHGNVRVIPCGIDLERFRPMDRSRCRRRLGWQDARFHVLFATGANDPVKRPWLARAAVEQLEKMGVPSELHIMSGIPNCEVPFWINGSDVFLLTSFQEGSPTVIKEVLACGVPIVSVDVGDVSEQISGIQGCLLANPDPNEIAAKLKGIQLQTQQFDCGGRLAAVSHITAARKLHCFYEELLARAANRKMSSATASADPR